MKFNKELRKYADKYKNKINSTYWFDYKLIKKLIKNALCKYPQFIASLPSKHPDESCCICLENDNLMLTFCCHNYIHHACMIHALAFCNSSCPLCRTDIRNAIEYNPTNNKEKFDSEIMAIISNIHLGIMRIENICNQKLITHPKLLQKYKKMNHTAIIKICKKIYKYLHIDVMQYFLDVIHKHGVLV